MSMIANFGPGMRERFLLEPDMAFLNHCSYGASPKEVLAVQSDLCQHGWNPTNSIQQYGVPPSAL
jgi:hypothetical protein